MRSADEEFYINELAKKIMRKGELGPTSHSNEVVAPSAASEQRRRRIMPDIDTFGQNLLS